MGSMPWDRDELTQSGTHVIETNFETVKHSSSSSGKELCGRGKCPGANEKITTFKPVG